MGAQRATGQGCLNVWRSSRANEGAMRPWGVPQLYRWRLWHPRRPLRQSGHAAFWVAPRVPGPVWDFLQQGGARQNVVFQCPKPGRRVTSLRRIELLIGPNRTSGVATGGKQLSLSSLLYLWGACQDFNFDLFIILISPGNRYRRDRLVNPDFSFFSIAGFAQGTRRPTFSHRPIFKIQQWVHKDDAPGCGKQVCHVGWTR